MPETWKHLWGEVQEVWNKNCCKEFEGAELIAHHMSLEKGKERDLLSAQQGPGRYAEESMRIWILVCCGLWVGGYLFALPCTARQGSSQFPNQSFLSETDSSVSPQASVESLMKVADFHSAVSLVAAISEIQRECQSVIFNQPRMASLMQHSGQRLVVDQTGEIVWTRSTESGSGVFNLGVDAVRQLLNLTHLAGWTQIVRQRGNDLELDYLTSILRSSELAPVDQKILLVQVWPAFNGDFHNAVPYLSNLYQMDLFWVSSDTATQSPEQTAMRNLLNQQKRDLYLRGLDLLELKKQERRKARTRLADIDFQRRLAEAYHSFTVVLPEEINKFKLRK